MNIEAFFYPDPVPINYLWQHEPWVVGRTPDTTDYVIKISSLGAVHKYYTVPWYARYNWDSDDFFWLYNKSYSSEFINELFYSTSLEF